MLKTAARAEHADQALGRRYRHAVGAPLIRASLRTRVPHAGRVDGGLPLPPGESVAFAGAGEGRGEGGPHRDPPEWSPHPTLSRAKEAGRGSERVGAT
jgi:hypothetical protein